MSQYPINTQQQLLAAANYLASGPSGLGQQFRGFSDYETVYLTGNYRLPFTQSNTARVLVANIACSSAVQLSDTTFQFNFANVQSSPPFSNGNPITSYNFTYEDPDDFWNGGWGPIGVVSCSNTNVVVRTTSSYSNIANVTTGLVGYNVTNTLNSTDCNARVTVQGATDTVFISAQLSDNISYSGSGNLTYTVQVNRYVGFTNNDPTNPDYLFNFDKTISQKVYTFNSLSGTAVLPEVETVFNTVIDQPAPGYYWYILEVEFDTTNSLEVTQAAFGLRSLTTQVVKQ